MRTAMSAATRKRSFSLLATCLVAIVVACSFPTEGCGCSPAREAAIVAGVLQNSAGVPQANVHLLFDGIPQRLDSFPFTGESFAVTGRDGSFRAIVYSAFGDGQMYARVAVRDSGRVSKPIARIPVSFRSSGKKMDSVFLYVTIP